MDWDIDREDAKERIEMNLEERLRVVEKLLYEKIDPFSEEYDCAEEGFLENLYTYETERILGSDAVERWQKKYEEVTKYLPVFR